MDGGAFSSAPSSKGELDGGRRWMSDKARKFAVGPGDAGAELLPLSVFISLWWRHPSSQGRLEDMCMQNISPADNYVRVATTFPGEEGSGCSGKTRRTGAPKHRQREEEGKRESFSVCFPRQQLNALAPLVKRFCGLYHCRWWCPPCLKSVGMVTFVDLNSTTYAKSCQHGAANENVLDDRAQTRSRRSALPISRARHGRDTVSSSP